MLFRGICSLLISPLFGRPRCSSIISGARRECASIWVLGMIALGFFLCDCIIIYFDSCLGFNVHIIFYNFSWGIRNSKADAHRLMSAYLGIEFWEMAYLSTAHRNLFMSYYRVRRAGQPSKNSSNARKQTVTHYNHVMTHEETQ